MPPTEPERHELIVIRSCHSLVSKALIFLLYGSLFRSVQSLALVNHDIQKNLRVSKLDLVLNVWGR